jgi:protoporphyrinogen/coproporphyrinogen III oxidase
LLALVRAELATILGVRAAPLFTRTFRWQDGYPQYTVGHLDRVRAIERALPAGLYVTGSSYRGVGVPDCVRQGQEVALQAIATLSVARAQ